MNISKQHILNGVRIAFLMLFVLAFTSRCARIMTPEGGPRDTIPPVIVTMLPDNYATNMKERKIYITFDEYIQLKDQQKEFFTSPQMKKKPQISLRGKGLLIQIKDTLKENTTYALNFGSTIRDNNEGNPLFSMRYVFSTGDTVDSIICSGYTADSYKADSVGRSYIWFFPVDSIENKPEYDSTLFKYKPAVIARAETNGIFIAQNLKPIKYRTYAIYDKNDNQMYEPSVDQVGFTGEDYNPIELPDFGMWYDSIRRYVTAEPQLYFRMFTDVTFKRQILQQHDRPEQHKAMLYFGAAHPKIESIKFDSISMSQVIVDPQTIGRDTIALWFTAPSTELRDTIRGEITYMKHDSLNVLQPSTEKLKFAWRKIESKEEQKEREKLERDRKKAEANGEEWREPKKKSQFAFKLPLSGDLSPEENLKMEFDYPIAKIDSAAILLTLTKEDKSITDIPVRFVRDTANLRHWNIVAPLKTLGQYTLTIPQGALTDIAGFSNDSIVGKYNLMDPEKMANVKLTVKDKGDGSKYIIQLLDGNNALKQEKRDVVSGLYTFNYVHVGEIKFRIVEDVNGNGKWDSGNVVERRSPERAEIYMSADGKDIFTTKANWEFEIEMDMSAIFAPVTMNSLIKMLDEREAQRIKREAEKRAKEGDKNKNKNNQDNNNNNQNQNLNTTGGMFNNNNNNSLNNPNNLQRR